MTKNEPDIQKDDGDAERQADCQNCELDDYVKLPTWQPVFPTVPLVEDVQ